MRISRPLTRKGEQYVMALLPANGDFILLTTVFRAR